MDPADVIQQLLAESDALEQAGDTAGAFSRTRQAMNIVHERQNSPDVEAMVLVRLGKLKFRLGDYTQGQKLARKTLEIASEDSLAYASAFLLLGNCAAETNSLNKAESYFQRVLALCCEFGFAELRFRALNSLGIAVYYPRGQLELAITAGLEAVELVRQLNIHELLWYPRANLAFLYWLTGRRLNCQDMLDELARVIVPGAASEGYHWCLKALFELEEGCVKEAVGQFSQALRIGDLVGEPGLRILARIGLSRAFRHAGDGPSALEWAETAFATAERVHYTHFGGWALIERGRAAWDVGRLDRAEADFRKANLLLTKLQAHYDMARSSMYLAAILNETHDPMAPITWLDAVRQVISGNYTFLVIQELDLIYPLIETYLESPDPEIAAWTQKLLNQVQKSPPPPLRVVTLGKLQVWVGLNLVPARALRQRRAGELLVLLLYSPNRSLLFDQVSECLWPGRDPALTKTLFHHACASLRQALEPGLPSRLVSRYLAIKDDRITLTVPENSWIDGDVFEGHYHKGEWQSCIDLYRGDFLPDYLYADWTLSYRQRFVQLILNALAARIQTCERDGQPRELLELCQQILSLEPWHEPATLAGMRACQHMNDRTGALRLYQNLEKTMKNELSVAPSAEVQAFYQELIQSSG